MKIYHYHSVTGEYIGSSEAKPNPLQSGEYLIPAYATAIAPSDSVDKQAVIFSDGAWSVVADFRCDTFYSTSTGEAVVLKLGEVPDETMTDVPKPDGDYEWNGSGWVEREKTLEDIISFRLSAYREESDPLKNEAEYDALINGAEPDYTEWLAKVAEIKERYPLPAE